MDNGNDNAEEEDIVCLSYTYHRIDLTQDSEDPHPVERSSFTQTPLPHYVASWEGDGRSKELAFDLTHESSSSLASGRKQHGMRRKRKKQHTEQSSPPDPFSLSFPLPYLSSTSSSASSSSAVALPSQLVFSLLPADLVRTVFSYLNGAESFFVAARVSRLIRRIVTSNTRRQQATSSELNFQPYASLTTPSIFIACFTAYKPAEIRRLSLANCEALDTHTLQECICTLHSLQRLDLTWTNIEYDSISRIVDHCPQLVDLRISREQSFLGGSRAGSTIWGRECLDPAARPTQADLLVVHILRQLPHLMALDVGGFGLSPTFLQLADEQLAGKQLPLLSHLSFHDNQLFPFTLRQSNIIDSLLHPNLLYLDLFNVELAANMLLFVSSANRQRRYQLRYLDIGTNVPYSGAVASRLTGIHVPCLLHDYQQVEYLSLSGLSSVTGFVAQLDITYPLLRSLNLHGINLSQTECVLLPKYFPSLSWLDISQCSLTEQHIQDMSNILTSTSSPTSYHPWSHRLIHLNVSYNVYITTRSLLQLMGALDQLAELIVAGCHYVDSDRLIQYVKKCASAAALSIAQPVLPFAIAKQKKQLYKSTKIRTEDRTGRDAHVCRFDLYKVSETRMVAETQE